MNPGSEGRDHRMQRHSRGLGQAAAHPVKYRHGADRSSTYFDRRIIICDGGGQVRFSSAVKWYQHEVVNSH